MDMLEFERKYWQLNFKHLAGIDEAGRGPLAGPVIASAVIFPKEIDLPDIDNYLPVISNLAEIEDTNGSFELKNGLTAFRYLNDGKCWFWNIT